MSEAIRRVLVVGHRGAGAGLDAGLFERIRGHLAGALPQLEIRTALVTGHAEIRRATHDFLAQNPARPPAVICAGGSGSLREVGEAVLAQPSLGNTIAVGALRLGSGNVVARGVDTPADIDEATHQLAGAIRARRLRRRPAVRVRFVHDSGQHVRTAFTMVGFGAFGTVPRDVARCQTTLRTLGLIGRARRRERVNAGLYRASFLSRVALGPRAAVYWSLTAHDTLLCGVSSAGAIVVSPVPELGLSPRRDDPVEFVTLSGGLWSALRTRVMRYAFLASDELCIAGALPEPQSFFIDEDVFRFEQELTIERTSGLSILVPTAEGRSS